MTGREILEAWDEITHDRMGHSSICEPTCAACRLVALIDAALADVLTAAAPCTAGSVEPSAKALLHARHIIRWLEKFGERDETGEIHLAREFDAFAAERVIASRRTNA